MSAKGGTAIYTAVQMTWRGLCKATNGEARWDWPTLLSFSTPILKQQHFLSIEPGTEQGILHRLEKLSRRFEILLLLMNIRLTS